MTSAENPEEIRWNSNHSPSQLNSTKRHKAPKATAVHTPGTICFFFNHIIIRVSSATFSLLTSTPIHMLHMLACFWHNSVFFAAPLFMWSWKNTFPDLKLPDKKWSETSERQRDSSIRRISFKLLRDRDVQGGSAHETKIFSTR